MVMAVGWTFTFRQVRHATAKSVEDLVVNKNKKIANWFSTELTKDISGPIEIGSKDWNTVQNRIEALELPGDGFACLLDNNGQIICHPDFRTNKSLAHTKLGNIPIKPNDGQTKITLNTLPKTDPISGELDFSTGQIHYIASRYIPKLGARLIIHQPEAGLIKMSSHATMLLGLTAGFAAMAVLGLTGLITAGVMKRYDSSLENMNKGLEAEVKQRTIDNLAARDALIVGLAKLADCRDNETGLHLERISYYAVLLAQELSSKYSEIDDIWIDRIKLASSMHDIGKVGLPDEILLKPGKLTADERSRMQTHTTIGADTLFSIRHEMGDDVLLNMSIQVALEHHEHWDGNGYPLGIKGTQIALAARIVALADVYDALTSKRCYKESFSHAKARQIILQGRGTHFDPDVIDAFLAAEEAFDTIRNQNQPPQTCDFAHAA